MFFFSSQALLVQKHITIKSHDNYRNLDSKNILSQIIQHDGTKFEMFSEESITPMGVRYLYLNYLHDHTP